jgi:hypothetical protein
MRKASVVPIMLALIVALMSLSLASTDYQRGVLDGLRQGWSMAQRYDQAKAGDPTAYNLAVPDYNTWIEGIFGRNESLKLKPFAASNTAEPYSISKTVSPIHAIDASWNQTQQSLLPEPDASGLIKGYPAETYYSIGPALGSI